MTDIMTPETLTWWVALLGAFWVSKTAVRMRGTLEELRLALAMMTLRGSRPCPYP